MNTKDIGILYFITYVVKKRKSDSMRISTSDPSTAFQGMLSIFADLISTHCGIHGQGFLRTCPGKNLLTEREISVYLSNSVEEFARKVGRPASDYTAFLINATPLADND